MAGDRTTQIEEWINLLGSDFDKGCEALLSHVYERLHKLTAAIVNEDFPKAHGHTDDVAHDAWLRLHKALEQVQPTDVREFFGLASRQIRWTLLDLIRSKKGNLNPQQGVGDTGTSDTTRVGAEPGMTTHNPESLARWTDFHKRI